MASRIETSRDPLIGQGPLPVNLPAHGHEGPSPSVSTKYPQKDDDSKLSPSPPTFAEDPGISPYEDIPLSDPIPGRSRDPSTDANSSQIVEHQEDRSNYNTARDQFVHSNPNLGPQIYGKTTEQEPICYLNQHSMACQCEGDVVVPNGTNICNCTDRNVFEKVASNSGVNRNRNPITYEIQATRISQTMFEGKLS